MSPLLVFLGGGAGAVARYLVGEWAKGRGWVDHFPWHTFAINVVGSFVLGLLFATFRGRGEWYLLLGTGVCGGFTTFSTFSVEVVAMIDADRPGAAAGYAVGSALAAVAGAWVGLRVGAAVSAESA